MRTVLPVKRSGRRQSDYWHYVLHHSVQCHLNNREVAQFSYQVFPGLPYASDMAFRGLTQDSDFLDPPVASSCSPCKGRQFEDSRARDPCVPALGAYSCFRLSARDGWSDRVSSQSPESSS